MELHRAAQSLGKGGDRKGLPVVIAGAGFAAACAALRLLAAGFRPVLLQSPRARDLGGVEILPAAMADQLALLGLGDVLARAPRWPSCCAGTLGIESSGMPPLATVASLTTGYGGLSGLSGSAGSDFPAGSVR